MRERDVEKYLVAQVERRGGLCLKFTSPQRKNVPDRIVVMGGKVAFVECKATGERPTAAQRREHIRIRAQNVRMWVVDSIESVMFVVEKMII